MAEAAITHEAPEDEFDRVMAEKNAAYSAKGDEFDKAMKTPSQPAKPTPIQDTTADGPNVLDYAADAAKGLVHGVRATAHAMGDLLPEGMKDEAFKQGIPEESKPETIAGQVTSELTHVALSWAMGGGVLKGAGIATAGVKGAMAQTAAGDVLAADQDHERLSNVLTQYPWLQPVASLLAQNPTDSFIVGRAKATLEDVLTVGAASSVFNALHLGVMKALGKGATPEAVKLEKEVIAEAGKPSAGPEASTNGKPSLEELNPTASNQAAKNATSSVINDKYGDTGAAFRAMKPEEMKATLKTGKMQVGENPEGISAQLIGKSSTAIYHEGDGMVVRAGEHAPSGRFGEVHVNEASDPKLASYMIGGKEHSFDEASAKFAEKPITLTNTTGEPLVTLTAAKQAKFSAVMDKLVIKQEVGPIHVDKLEGPMAKQGSMNKKYMDSPNNVLASLEELGKLTKTELGKSTPAYRSVDETKTLAGIMGQDHASLIANLKASNASLENIDAIATGARMYLQTKGSEMWQVARKATLSGDPEAKAAFNAQFMHLSEFQAELSQMTTRLGRGLRSFGESVGPFDSGKMKAALADPKQAENISRIIAATDGNVDQIAHILKMQQMSLFQKVVGAHNEYWTGLGLLSRAATQVVNLSSTAIQALMEPASMTVGGVLRGVTGNGWTEAKQGISIYNGLRTGFFDSMKMAWAAAKTEHSIISQAGTMEQPTKYISALTWNMNPDTFMGKFIDLMGNVTRASFRGLTAGDEFFKQLSYRAKVSAEASAEAVDMVKAGTLAKDGIQAHVQQALQAAIDGAGAATNKGALQYAEKASFVNDLKGSTWGDMSSMGEMMARLSSHPILRGTVLPFVKTPTNVTRTTFEYTPLIGQLRKQFWSDMAAGGEKQASAIGKLTLGSGMYVGAMMLAIEGHITGAPPAPGVIMPTGWKPYSARIRGYGDNGGDLYISYQRMQPFGDILGLTADFAKTTGMLDVDTRNGLAHSMSLALAKAMSDPSEAALAVGASYGKSLISKTYYRNLTEFFSTFSGYNNENALLRFFQNYTASHVPGVISQFNSDDTVREVRSTMDAILARIPGLSQTLPPKRDYFGEIHDTKVGYPWSIIQPLAVSQTKGDVVMEELNRLSKGDAGMKFSEMDHFVTVMGKKQDLKLVKNDKGVTAYDRMNDLMQTVKPAGETKNFHDKLSEVMHGARYQISKDNPVLDGSPLYLGVRQKMIRAEEQDYRKAALDQTMKEFSSELGIPGGTSPMRAMINEKVARKKIRVGVADKLLDIANP